MSLHCSAVDLWSVNMAFPGHTQLRFVLWVFLRVPWVSLQCVIVVFPDHTYGVRWCVLSLRGRESCLLCFNSVDVSIVSLRTVQCGRCSVICDCGIFCS